MGTFHDNLGELHGITVVVDTHGPEVYVGRCHEHNDQKIIMHDVDVHRDGDKGVSKQAYIEQAAKWGVFKKFDHYIVPGDQIASVTRLGDLA